MRNKLKKTLLCLTLILFLLILTNTSVKAESTEERYGSQSGIGFYGEYTDPGNEKPDEGKPTDQVSKDESLVSGGNQQFPQTGMRQINYFSFGLMVLLYMGFIVIKNIKTKKESNMMKYAKIMKKSAVVLTVIGLGAPTFSALAEEGESYQSNGSVEFIANTDPVSPVDPENPDPEKPVTPIDPTDPTGTNPGTSGPLSIDYASSLDFGQNKITNKNETYYANAQTFAEMKSEYRGNYVQVTDNRGTNSGWALNLKQEGQLTSETAKQYKELTGAQISLGASVASSISEGVLSPVVTNVQLDPEGANSVIMLAKEGSGAGTWVDYFGKAEEMTIDGKIVQKNKSVTLEIPGKTPKEAVKYTTKLTWSLTDVPDDEV